ncbi:hypothetical protein GGI43DRAFT_2093 [Trichoderma evansii]
MAPISIFFSGWMDTGSNGRLEAATTSPAAYSSGSSLDTCLASPSQSLGPDAICDPRRSQSRGQTIPIQESSASWSGSLFSCSPVHSKPHRMTPGQAELFLFFFAVPSFFLLHPKARLICDSLAESVPRFFVLYNGAGALASLFVFSFPPSFSTLLSFSLAARYLV